MIKALPRCRVEVSSLWTGRQVKG